RQAAIEASLFGFPFQFSYSVSSKRTATINLQGYTAEALSYCRVILVGKQGEKEMKTTLYTIYKDVFVKENGKWLINTGHPTLCIGKWKK
ncbi:MAG TPA: nuclear transport factor 2 family protein, partial [Chitinophagaceae bacterium]